MGEFSGYKILIADDDPMFRLMLRQFLERNLFQVCEASNGKEAIEIFDRESPKMVLMDANMPVMSGIDACKRIREIDKYEYSPVLIMTAMDDDAFITIAFEAGAADYISKPIHWGVLKQRMLYKLKASRVAYALQTSEKRFRQLYQELPLPYLSLDGDGLIIEVNPAWRDMMGYKAEQLVVGRSLGCFLLADDWNSFLKQYSDFKLQEHLSNMQLQMLDSNGSVIDVELNARAGYDVHGSFKQFHCVLQNITRRKAMEDELRKLATTDPLTGLANRRAFFEKAGQMRLHAIRYQHSLSVMMLDIDHFKLINDTFGHDIGDDILKLVSDIMSQSLRDVDILGRLGGEEFAIVLPETGLSDAVAAAERIRASVEAFKLQTNQGEIDVKISIGVVLFCADDESIEALLKKADNLLYRAKERGRNRVEQETLA